MRREALGQLGVPGTVPPGPCPLGEGTHPRPMLMRAGWTTLDGVWRFAIDRNAEWERPDEVRFDRDILVPFAPETRASGIGDTSLYRAVWYQRNVQVPPSPGPDHRLLLHFNAVDYEARIFIDDTPVCTHEGGYTPFTVDLTYFAFGRDTVRITVRAFDDPADLAKPRGKQDWLREPHSIWYPRTTGIWQTVWLEWVPRTRIDRVRWTPSLERWEMGIEVRLVGSNTSRIRLRARLSAGDVVLVDDTYLVVASEVHRRIALSDPGIDDFRNALLWSPETPTLIAAELTLLDEGGTVIDRVESYTALRAASVEGDRFVLNGRPFPLRMVLDQGYWPESGMTAPTTDALRRDVELAKAMGFNGVRKHQKIEDPRYLYWADRLGLMVWAEMPSAYRFTRLSQRRMLTQWLEVLERDASHPCIVAWVPFNESWGVPNLPDSAAERHYVQSVYYATKSYDPTRPVIGNDGWESVITDIIGIHDYDADSARLAGRYPSYHVIPNLLQRARPGGRLLTVAGHVEATRPLVLSEFGGIALATRGGHTWGYSHCRDEGELAQRYAGLMRVVSGLDVFAGYCYTQFADTYQEANGLLRDTREPKFPLNEMRRAIDSEFAIAEGSSAKARPGGEAF